MAPFDACSRGGERNATVWKRREQYQREKTTYSQSHVFLPKIYIEYRNIIVTPIFGPAMRWSVSII